ncbi:MAG: hypothetical protein HKO05_06730 [Erythrobacter sp.]|nr:hypothetical protein [Erythrobacter sp.]
MTRFVDNFSTDHLLPPWISKDARSWVFVINVGKHCLENYIASHFNCGEPYCYEACDLPYGVLRITRHDEFSSGHPRNCHERTLRKIDVNWAYPVRRWQVSPDNIRYNQQIVWVEPVAFDNNSYTMFSSREIWGTEADMALISVEEDSQPSRLHVDVAMEGIRKFSPKSKSHMLGIMHVEMGSEDCTDLKTEEAKHPQLKEFVDLLFKSVRLEGQPLDINRHGELNTLKQFRDVFNMREAVYRALIASNTDHSDIKNLKFYDGSTVKLDFMWSDTVKEVLIEQFGLECEEPDSHKPRGHPEGSEKIEEVRVDWNLPRLTKEVALAASFTSDIRYEITGTLHTYGD